MEAIAEEIYTITGYKFKDLSLLQQALTHPSVYVSGTKNANYERLEFVGDAILGAVVSEMLYNLFPDDSEGYLTRRKTYLVCGQQAVKVAQSLNLGRMMLLSEGEAASNGFEHHKNLENLLEAIIGAISMDGGIEAARSFILKLWKPLAERMPDFPPQDPKTALQEWAQSKNLPTPNYRVKSKTGMEHSPVFTVEVSLKDCGSVVGTGNNKKSAEREAARAMLSRIPVEGW
ncbi:ribonuclease III [Anaplasma bovis]|uniref:ribonuclease III n=1 Tax=Anaplasma bovis TaxID=186733 RepID=UPI002FF09024